MQSYGHQRVVICLWAKVYVTKAKRKIFQIIKHPFFVLPLYKFRNGFDYISVQWGLHIVCFGILSIIKNRNFFTLEITDKAPSLIKFWRYLADVKIVKIGHSIGYIGCPIKNCSIKVKKKSTKKCSRKPKIWYMYNVIMVLLFT